MHVDSYPGIKSIHHWFPANQGFYANFLDWLAQASYSKHVVKLYAFGARIALGFLDKPYWLLDPVADFERVQAYLTAHFECEGTRSSYAKGVSKLQQYLIQRCHRPMPERSINWQYYLDSLPTALCQDLQAYVSHCRRTWPSDRRYDRAIDLLSPLTRPLRWIAQHASLRGSEDVTPLLWFDYADARLAGRVCPRTINGELQSLQSFLRFLAEQSRPVCERTLKIEPLCTGPVLPRDVPVPQLRRLLTAIEIDAQSGHAGVRRMGLLDKAWFFLMLHSGLRTGEVRRLRLEDLDFERQRVRIEQSKGLKDRIVCLSQTTIQALQTYLKVRGPMASSHLFVYRHLPLSESYCSQRLATYANRCGVRVTPHQLRHSCATLLLNAGAPILTVQTILGHRHIDTTLGYARLYDGTVAADYYRAMGTVESRMKTQENGHPVPIGTGQFLALIDALQAGTLNDAQRETVTALRTAILALA